jgi:hypothetical protein
VGGRQSYYGDGFVKACLNNYQFDMHEIINGGKFEDLQNINFQIFDTIFWFANIPNDKPKLVDNIKKINPFCLLITSKRNDGGDYTLPQLIARALHTKSNLFVEFQRLPLGYITATVFDPLGNCYIHSAKSSRDLAVVLIKRLKILHTFKRKPSRQINRDITTAELEHQSCCLEKAQQIGFFDLIRKYANRFSDLIPAQTERFLGNTSFRCSFGFPSFRSNGTIFISKRNIDKCNIDKDGFVALSDSNEVEYYGNSKPSIDAPVQKLLYYNFPYINFMIHSHTYIKNAAMTSEVIPCGAIEEFDEILKIVPSSDCNWFFVNLRGHGSICAAKDLKTLCDIQYYARPLPENQIS